MAAVLTTSMTLRIILSVRGTLAQGGSFALSGSTTNTSASRTTHVISTRSNVPHPNIASPANTYTLDNIRSKPAPEPEWEGDSKLDSKSSGILPESEGGNEGVQVKVDRQVDYDSGYARHR